MKKTLSLALLFFAGLAVLWWLEYARIPRRDERLARMDRVLRDLFDTRVREIDRLEIRRGDQLTRFERRDVNRWRMIKPFEAAADPAAVENLIQNVIGLSRSPDVGTIHESDPSYGLDPPSAVIRVDGARRGSEGRREEIHAVLEVGKVQQGLRFVRPHGERGIEAVDAKLLNAIDQPLVDWRERSLVPIPTFQVVDLAIQGERSGYQAERSRAGGWTLREPVRAPANGIKIENLLAGLSSLRVSDGAKGFVENDVKDLGKYGLDRPELTVTLTTNGPRATPIVLQFGKPAPNDPAQVFAKSGDQDDVILVPANILSQIPRTAKELRVGQVADIDPTRVARIEIDAPPLGTKFALNRTSTGWKQTQPNDDPVDGQTVQALIAAIAGLQSSERFDAQGTDDPRMTPLSMTLRLWQSRPSSPGAGDTSVESRPAVSLQFGRHDVLRKTIYGRLEGDSLVLAIPDLVVKRLPKNAFAFRNRALPAINLGRIRTLSIQREGQTFEMIPAKDTGPANAWRLVKPVPGNVDMPTLSQLFASLSRLRAEDFVAEAKTDEQGRKFGLDRPTIEISWELEAPAQQSSTASSERAGRLKVGGRVGRTSSHYARLDNLPMIFTLDAETVASFESELYDHNVLAFAADRVEKIVIRWPRRTLSLGRQPGSANGPAVWKPEAANDASGVDLAQIDSMVNQLARLQTIKFIQHQGIIPVMTGLVPPRLAIEVYLKGEPVPKTLRIGTTSDDGAAYGATGTGGSGPVFVLPAAAWDRLVEAGRTEIGLPDDVFAPTRP